MCHVCFDLYVIDLCVIDLCVVCVFVHRCGIMDSDLCVMCVLICTSLICVSLI